MLVSDLGAVNWLRPFMVLSQIYGISALCGDSSYVALSVLVTKKPFPFPFCSSSLPPLYPLSLHPLSISFLYPISTCDSHPFNTPYLCSHSTLPLYTPLYYPTLQPPDSPYFKIRSLHSHSSLSLYTPLISYSLPSASTPFSTISTAQSPLGSPLVTRQPPLYN